MKLILKVSVPVEIYEVKLEYSEYEEKMLFQACVEYIEEAKGNGLFSEKELVDGISRDLFFRPNHQVFARRVLDILEKENYILKENGTLLLTSLGQELRQTGQFRAKFEDVFSIEVIRNHPIIGNQLVSINPITLDRSNDLKSSIQNNKEPKPKLDEIKLESLEGKRFLLFEGKSIFIESIGKKGKKIKKKVNYNLKLVVDNDAQILELIKSSKEKIDYTDILVENFPEITLQEALRQIFSNEKFEFENGKIRLNLEQYQEFKNQSLTIDFIRDFEINQPKLKFKDKPVSFKKITIKSMQCIPKNIECAERWANDRLQSKISGYLDREEYNNLKQETFERFNELGFSVTLPDYDRACETWGLSTSDKLFWFIQASIDLTQEVLQ